MNLSKITNRKFIESYPGNGRTILTPNGYKEIIEVHKTIKYKKFRIELDNGLFLECAYNHVIIDENNSEIFADNSLNKIIKTEIGNSKVINVIDLCIEEHMYDISIDSSDELYYSNGILSHNSGKTVTVGIYLSHLFIFKKEINIGIAANKSKQSIEFLDKTKKMIVELPAWMQTGVSVWNKTFVENENGVRIITDSTSSDSFRGFTCAVVVVDETAFIKSTMWEEFSDSIFPSQSGLAWKKNILISTANGLNHFHDIIKGGRDDSNGYKIFEVNWKNVPRYRPDGSKMPPEEFQHNIIKKYGPIYFNQNYANEFVGSSHTLISADKLKQLKEGEIEEIRDNKLKVYKYPERGHQYIMTVDAAKDGQDAFAVNIVDITDFTFEQVASAKLQIDYLLMPEFLNEWCEWYNNPYLIIENNEGAGQSVADQMYQTYEYENLHFDKDVGRNKRKKYPGFRTTTKSRKQILQTLKLFIENDKLNINNKDTIQELFQFILIKNKYQADDGAHDDMIMSLAMTFVPFVNTKNFEDMGAVIKQLYSDELQYDKDDKVNFGDMLTIGDFQDGSDDEFEPENRGLTWDGYGVVDNSDGFY